MIEYLTGKIKCKLTTGIILDVNGVGYGVDVPLTTLCEIPKVGEKAELWIFTKVKEDSFKLYGFMTQEERRAFEVLLMINGVGPKVALAIMSTLTVRTLVHAAESNQPEIIQVVPGIGKAKAEKILVELKSKVTKLIPKDELSSHPLEGQAKLDLSGSGFSQEQNILVSDLHMALENLGYKAKDVSSLINTVVKENDTTDFGDLMKLTLSELGSGKSKTSKTKVSPLAKNQEQLDTLF